MELPLTFLHAHRFGDDFIATLGSWGCIWRQFCKTFSKKCSPPPQLVCKHRRRVHPRCRKCPSAEGASSSASDVHFIAVFPTLHQRGAGKGRAALPAHGMVTAERQKCPRNCLRVWRWRRFCRRDGSPSVTSFRTLSERVFKFLEKVDDGLKCSRNEPL